MKEQVHVFFTALMFYTRIPCPKWVNHDPSYLNKATVFFPVIGWIVGGISFLAFWVASGFFSPFISLMISLAASVLTTGAFHEDGFADMCDGFGGGWTKEKILLIMKDSRVGTYGVVGLILLFSLKIGALFDIANKLEMREIAFLFLSTHASSRLMAASCIFTHEYARDNEDSKAKPIAKKMSISRFIIAIFLGLLPLILWSITANLPILLFIILPMYGFKIYMASYCQKWIGGYTGDCLGAIQQVTEVVFYLGYLWVLG